MSHKSTLRVLSQVLVGTMGSFIFGYGMGVFNTVQDIVAKQLDWPEDKKNFNVGLVTSTVALGAAFGAYLGGIVVSKFGRRLTLIIADIITIVAVFPTLVSNLGSILVGRILLGFAIGINSSVVPLYIREVSPNALSGTSGSCHQLLISLGILLSLVLGYGLPTKDDADFGTSNWWKIMFAIPLIPSAIRILGLMFIFTNDTPQYLSQIGKIGEAEAALSDIYHYEEVNIQMEQLKQERQRSSGEITLGTLFGPRYRKALFIGITLSWIQQFSGINAVVFYSTKIFQGSFDPKAVISAETMKTVGIFNALFGIINAVSAFAAALVVDKAGRKAILMIGNLLCFVFLGALAYLVYAQNFTVSRYFVLLYDFAFGISLGPIVWLYISEILPAQGIAVAVFFNWIFTLIVGLGFPIISDPKVLDAYGGFLLFAVCCILGEVFITFVVKETQGKTLVEAQNLYNDAQGDEEDTQAPFLKAN